jgi:hypothetical protein
MGFAAAQVGVVRSGMERHGQGKDSPAPNIQASGPPLQFIYAESIFIRSLGSGETQSASTRSRQIHCPVECPVLAKCKPPVPAPHTGFGATHACNLSRLRYLQNPCPVRQSASGTAAGRTDKFTYYPKHSRRISATSDNTLQHQPGMLIMGKSKMGKCVKHGPHNRIGAKHVL